MNTLGVPVWLTDHLSTDKNKCELGGSVALHINLYCIARVAIKTLTEMGLSDVSCHGNVGLEQLQGKAPALHVEGPGVQFSRLKSVGKGSPKTFMGAATSRNGQTGPPATSQRFQALGKQSIGMFAVWLLQGKGSLARIKTSRLL